MATPAYAGGLVTKHSASVQLTVDAARATATRIGSSFSISGSNIDTTDGSTAGTVSAGTITSGVYNPGTIAATQDTAGAAFSFSQSYTQGTLCPQVLQLWVLIQTSVHLRLMQQARKTPWQVL